MDIKSFLGNIAVALGGFFGAKTTVLAAAATQAAAAAQIAPQAAIGYAAQFHEPYSLVGLIVPNWLGAVLYITFLLMGALFGANQETPVDKKFTRPYLKPVYSLVFGAAMTLFVMPLFYPDITIWGLIFPALFFSAIGAVVIYFVIAFFTSERLWLPVTEWGHGSVLDVLAVMGGRIKAAVKAFFGGEK